MELSKEQRKELERAAHCGEPGYVRIKALALLNLAEGQGVSAVAGIFHVSRQSLYTWMEHYRKGGLERLRVQPGRGRKPQANREELERYLRRSPREFGLRQTRWSLAALAEVVPSLKGFTPYGVQKALARAGYRYKRGQPWLHSPDPQYEGKKGRWTKR